MSPSLSLCIFGYWHKLYILRYMYFFSDDTLEHPLLPSVSRLRSFSFSPLWKLCFNFLFTLIRLGCSPGSCKFFCVLFSHTSPLWLLDQLQSYILRTPSPSVLGPLDPHYADTPRNETTVIPRWLLKFPFLLESLPI